MVARRVRKKNWYDKHLGTSKAGKVYWRLPKVKAGHCCGCGEDMHKKTTYDSFGRDVEETRTLEEGPFGGDGVFCADCASEKKSWDWAECCKVVTALLIKRGFPNVKVCDRTTQWIRFWKTDRDQSIPGITQNDYAMPTPDPELFPNWKWPSVPAKEKRAAKAIRSKLKVLVKAAGRRNARGDFADFAPGYAKEKTAAKKAMRAYCKAAGWAFTPPGREARA